MRETLIVSLEIFLSVNISPLQKKKKKPEFKTPMSYIKINPIKIKNIRKL